jgi:hypothetical protein
MLLKGAPKRLVLAMLSAGLKQRLSSDFWFF